MLRGLRSLLKVPDRKREQYFAPTGMLALQQLCASPALCGRHMHSLLAAEAPHRCLACSICQRSCRLKRQMLNALSKDELDTLGMHTAGLYPNNDVDLRKLKKLIQAQKLAPCFPGADSDTHEVRMACLPATQKLSETKDVSRLLAAGGVPHLLPVLPIAQQGTVLLQKHLHRVLPASKSLPLLGHPAMRPSVGHALGPHRPSSLVLSSGSTEHLLHGSLIRFGTSSALCCALEQCQAQEPGTSPNSSHTT